MSERKRVVGGGGEGRERGPVESMLHEVAEVYVYIPPELSAAGVELKLAGSVRVVNKVIPDHCGEPFTNVKRYIMCMKRLNIMYTR